MKNKTLTIDREKWLRGPHVTSTLLNKQGHMCCLGFYSLACGLTKDQILDMGEPINVIDNGTELPEEMKWLVDERDPSGMPVNSHDGYLLMDTNDSHYDKEKTREAEIRRLFKKNGVKIRFVN